MTRLIELHSRADGTAFMLNPDHVVSIFNRGGKTAIGTSTGFGFIEVTETLAHVSALVRGDEFYSCDFCELETESEGAIARHYDTFHPEEEL